MTGNAILTALQIPTRGQVYELAKPRRTGQAVMPLHPPITVLPYRTPQGLLQDPAIEWAASDVNPRGVAFISDYVTMTTHTGTHVDALGHITRGTPAEWRGGNADTDLTDFGLRRGGAEELPPQVGRGVLLDVAALHDAAYLPRAYGITVDDLERAEARQGSDVRVGDIVLIRTGAGAVWDDADRMAATAGAGLTLDAARWLTDRGVTAIGADTEAVEQVPSSQPENPHPVHEHVLLEHGIPLIEMVYLEELAAADEWSFLYIAVPVKIAGATAGLADPIAIV